MNSINKEDLILKKVSDLKEIAKAVGVQAISKYNKEELVVQILQQIDANEKENEKNISNTTDMEMDEVQEPSQVCGILDLHADGYGFLRSNGYDSGENDVYVPPVQVRRFHLKTGDYVEGLAREKREKEKFNPLIYIKRVNDRTPENLWNRADFEDLTPIYPREKICLETSSQKISTRLIDLVCPIGKGQRGLIVSQPKTGKTTLLKTIANAINENNPEVFLIVLLVDERPEEVTDMRRSVKKAEVVASTFDETPQNHTRLSEIVIERAKRLVENKKDVVILVDSITRLSRAYNMTTPSSGKTLSGGLDPMAMHGPKKFFGAARNIEEGGSLTILATALVDTGSRMDDVIFEEFKGTGNMEVHLDRSLSELRIFPSMDIYKSGTRKEELLLTEKEQQAMVKIRRALNDDNNFDVANKVITMIKNTSCNDEFVDTVSKIEFK